MARIANDVPVSLFSYSEITIERSSIKIIGRKSESILPGKTAGLREQTSYCVFSCAALHADKDLASRRGPRRHRSQRRHPFVVTFRRELQNNAMQKRSCDTLF